MCKCKIISKYFKELTPEQVYKFNQLSDLYGLWNERINVISRKDIDFLYERHVLHALSIGKVIQFDKDASVIDVGTGGGFPGIPLAILFPETKFYLIDSIGKKIKVVQTIKETLNLENVKSSQTRVEKVTDTFDFVISRAVTRMPQFVGWVKNLVKKDSRHDLANGILYLKGGDLTSELSNYQQASIYNISDFFDEPFFETKKIIHLPL